MYICILVKYWRIAVAILYFPNYFNIYVFLYSNSYVPLLGIVLLKQMIIAFLSNLRANSEVILLQLTGLSLLFRMFRDPRF